MKKLIAMLLIGAMTLSLAACGDSSSNQNEPNQTDDNGEEQNQGTADESSELSGKIVYYSMWQETEPQAEILKAAIDEFTNANPDVEVEVQWMGRTVLDLAIPAIQAGEQVDIFDSDTAGTYQVAADYMLDLTDFYESTSLDGTTAVKDNIMAGLIELDKASSEEYSDGANRSLPYNPYCIDFFYNTEHFAAAGIDKVPETWEELEAACAKLKEAGYEPIVTDDAYSNLMFCYYLERRVGEDTIKEMSENENWESEGVLETLQAMEDFASKGYFAESIKTNKYPAGQQQFARQEASMYFNASFMAAENAKTAGDDFPYGHFAFPTVPNGTGTLTENTVGAYSFSVNKDTENKDAVYELLRYFVGENYQQDFLDHGLTPNLTSLEWPAPLADQKAIVDSLTRNIVWGASCSGETYTTAIAPNILSVMLGEKTAQDAYNEIVAASK